MIFAIFAFFWVLTATTILMLVLPTMLVMMRGSYLDRQLFPAIQWIPIITALMVFFYLLEISDRPVITAALQAGRILASSILLIHFMYGVARSGAVSFGAQLGTLFLLIQRCMILETRLVSNAAYSLQTRFRRSKISLSEASGLIRGMILTITSELLRLADEIHRLYNSRGSNPVTKGWVIPPARKVPVTVGDIILVLVIGFALTVGLDGLIPGSIVNLCSALWQ